MLQEMLGKMTWYVMLWYLYVLVTLDTTAASAVKYSCTQNSSVSRAQVEVAFYKQGN